MLKSDNILEKDIVWAMLFGLVAFVVCIWRCRYFENYVPDEIFYESIPWRWMNGEVMFRHELKLSIIQSVMLTPFVRIAKWILSLDCGIGIALAMRGIFSAVWAAVAAVSFARWLRFSTFGAFLGAMLFVILPPYERYHFSPHSLGVIFMSLAVAFGATNVRGCRRDWLLSGFFLALAVPCHPFLSLLYFLFAGYAFFRDRRAFMFVTIGCVASTLIYLVLFFWQVSPTELIAYVNGGLFSDGEHGSSSLAFKAYLAFSYFLALYGFKCIGLFAVGLIVASFLDKSRLRHAPIYVGMWAIVALVGLMWMAFSNTLWMHIYLAPIVIFAISVIVFLRPEGCVKIAFLGLVPGLFYAIVNPMCSNTYYLASAVGLSVALIPAASLMFAALSERFLQTDIAHPKFLRVVFIAVFVVTTAFSINRYFFIADLTGDAKAKTICNGSLKGLRAESCVADKMECAYEEMRPVFDNDAVHNILVLGHRYKWLYLCSDKGIGAFSLWLSLGDLNERSFDKLRDFWYMTPDKLPDVVFWPVEAGVDEVSAARLAQEYQYRIELLPSGNRMLLK